jgi:hypothetical protein
MPLSNTEIKLVYVTNMYIYTDIAVYIRPLKFVAAALFLCSTIFRRRVQVYELA